MNYGCIGEHLKHSFSKEIHNLLADYEYEIREIEKDKLGEFMSHPTFHAINVTIPYKELVIPYLEGIDEHARQIGAVNTVVNRGGKLYGYNTDFYGVCRLIDHSGVSVVGKKVAILGTGGTSKTALSVCRYLGAESVVRISRTSKEDAISYSVLYENHSDTEVIINTTPVGMFPSCYDSPVDLKRFVALSGVIDAIYNPLRTPLVSEALRLGIKAEGGLYMLVAQAVRASEIFLDTTYPEGTIDKVFKKVLRQKENIVLVGMPSCGKTTVGNILSEITGRQLLDTDKMVTEATGEEIPDIFSSRGEGVFRDLESDAVRKAASGTGLIIATGGGAVLRPENLTALKQNGIVYFIDRPLNSLIPTEDRPLSSTKEAIEKRYRERYPIYKGCCDSLIDADKSAELVASSIISAHFN